MLTLYGFSYSNYHNIVKHTLMYKGVPFDEQLVYPGTPEMMAVNPTGKVPAMTTERGTHLSESSVMVDYIEEVYPDNPLYPSDAEERARVRQVMKVSELYLDLAARRLLGALLFDMPLDDDTRNEVRAMLERGTRSVNALASFAPYVMGSEISLADIYLRYALLVPTMVGPPLLDWDVMDDIDGLADWSAMMADSDISRKVDADMAANEPGFRAYIAGMAG